MSVTILSSEEPFAKAVNEARPSDTPLEATVNPVGRFWNTVRLPYAEYLNETVADSVYLYPSITNPGLLSRYVKGEKPDAVLTDDDLAVLNGLYNLAMLDLPAVGRSKVIGVDDDRNWATLVYGASVNDAIRHTTYGVGGLGGRYLFSSGPHDMFFVHYLEPDRP